MQSIVALVFGMLAVAQGALSLPTQTRTAVHMNGQPAERSMGRRGAMAAALAAVVPFAAQASPGSYIQGTEEAKLRNTMNNRVLPGSGVNVERKNVYTGKKTTSFQLTGKPQKK